MLISSRAEDLEDLGGDARVRAHAGADDRDLADLLVGADPSLTSPSAAIVSVAVVSSARSTVKERSASSSSPTGSFWMITSTLTLASARAVKMRPATPGSSRTPVSVTRASASEWVTAVTKGCSMVSCSVSSSLTTRVPGPSSKLLRQWIRTPWLRAYSTERSCSTPAPEADISSISSKETTGSLRASGTIRGSALKTPATSV